MEKYDRLRESLQDPENDPKDSEDFANLPSNQQQNLPSLSTSRIPSVPTPSILSSLLSEVDVDQPKNSQPADPHDTLSQPCRALTGHANGSSSPLSTAQDINSSSGSPQAEKHCSMVSPLLLIFPSPASDVTKRAYISKSRPYLHPTQHLNLIRALSFLRLNSKRKSRQIVSGAPVELYCIRVWF